MARMATIATPDLRGRVRCCPASHTNNSSIAESFRILSAEGTYTLRDWPNQRRIAVAVRFWPTGEAKGMDLQPEESVSIFAFRSLYLSPRGGHHRRVISNVRRICWLSG